MQLQQVIEQIQNEIRINDEGLSTVSIRGAARLADVDNTGLGKSLKTGAELKPSLLAVYLMDKGFNPADLTSWSTEGIPDLGLSIILTYYAYKAGRYCTKLAELCCEAFQAIGIRTWLQQAQGWQSRDELAKLGDKYVKQFNTLKRQSPVTAKFIFEILAQEVGIDVSQQQELALNASLVANRLGLSFNKSLKAFESIQNKTSPDAFEKLKAMYEKLTIEHQELLEIKTPNPTVKYVEKFVTVEVEDKTRVEFLESKLVSLEYELSELRIVNVDLTTEIKFLESNIRDLECELEHYKAQQIQVKPQTNNRFLLPGS